MTAYRSVTNYFKGVYVRLSTLIFLRKLIYYKFIYHTHIYDCAENKRRTLSGVEVSFRRGQQNYHVTYEYTNKDTDPSAPSWLLPKSKTVLRFIQEEGNYIRWTPERLKSFTVIK